MKLKPRPVDSGRGLSFKPRPESRESTTHCTVCCRPTRRGGGQPITGQQTDRQTPAEMNPNNRLLLKYDGNSNRKPPRYVPTPSFAVAVVTFSGGAVADLSLHCWVHFFPLHPPSCTPLPQPPVLLSRHNSPPDSKSLLCYFQTLLFFPSDQIDLCFFSPMFFPFGSTKRRMKALN